jgi:hypothetical protein
MADVVQKIISGNDIQQGSAVSHVTKTGNVHSLLPDITNAISITDTEAKWTNRFDDIDYYGTKFSPLIISGCEIWLAADKITGLVDGDVVATWSDSSTGGNEFYQSTASKKPVYKTDIFNSSPAIKFDGVDDVLLSTLSSEVTGATNYSLFVVFSFIDESNFTTPFTIGAASYPMIRFFQLDASSPRNIIIQGKNASNVIVSSASGSDVSVGSGYIGSVINESGGNITQNLNGLEDASGTAYDLSSHAVDRFALGAASTGSSTANCYIAEVLFYNVALGPSQKKRIESYFSRKYGIAVP